MKDDFKNDLMPFLLEAANAVHLDNDFSFYVNGDVRGIINLCNALKMEQEFTAAQIVAGKRGAVANEVQGKSFLYSLLADEESRQTVIRIAAYAILGPLHVKFPYYESTNILVRERLFKKYADTSVQAHELARSRGLFYFKIPALEGLRLYAAKDPFYNYMTGKQDYFCQTTSGNIRPEQGDIIIDCGACHGDTALFFALEAGKRGKIISFEPTADGVAVFKENMKANPKLAERITLIERATWNVDDTTLTFKIHGPGSAAMEAGGLASALNSATESVTTMTVDTAVNVHTPEKVDFIKMDVEGSELESLRGAKQTLQKFRPKLAICLYHKPQVDFQNIPAFLHSLDLGYEFFVRHHFMNQWETVLYARTKKTTGQ